MQRKSATVTNALDKVQSFLQKAKLWGAEEFKAEISQIFQYLTNEKVLKIVIIFLKWKLRYAKSLQLRKTASIHILKISCLTIQLLKILIRSMLILKTSTTKCKDKLIDLQLHYFGCSA